MQRRKGNYSLILETIAFNPLHWDDEFIERFGDMLVHRGWRLIETLKDKGLSLEGYSANEDVDDTLISAPVLEEILDLDPGDVDTLVEIGLLQDRTPESDDATMVVLADMLSILEGIIPESIKRIHRHVAAGAISDPETFKIADQDGKYEFLLADAEYARRFRCLFGEQRHSNLNRLSDLSDNEHQTISCPMA